jgi:hypothetical protein
MEFPVFVFSGGLWRLQSVDVTGRRLKHKPYSIPEGNLLIPVTLLREIHGFGCPERITLPRGDGTYNRLFERKIRAESNKKSSIPPGFS